MFQLLTVEDTIILEPQDLENVEARLLEALRERYQGKVRKGSRKRFSQKTLADGADEFICSMVLGGPQRRDLCLPERQLTRRPPKNCYPRQWCSLVPLTGENVRL